jgi:hypothetical protein
MPFDKALFDELKRKERILMGDRDRTIELLGIVRLRIQEVTKPITGEKHEENKIKIKNQIGTSGKPIKKV